VNRCRRAKVYAAFLNEQRAVSIPLKNFISYVVPTYNDEDAFLGTISSLVNQVISGDEIVIVDSSSSCYVEKILNIFIWPCELVKIWAPPQGVYVAQNLGILRASREWIQILNSGDRLLPNGRCVVGEILDSSSSNVQMHVFSQQVSSKNFELEYVFTPTPNGIWPHQSIIASQYLYKNLGTYSLDYKLASDQIYFSRAREIYAYKLYDYPLTDYDDGGISSRVNLKACHEIYALNLALSQRFFLSALKGYVFPYVRFFLEHIFGKRMTMKIKVFLNKNYAATKIK
jgi:glycosyltransferase involved in cell wall biosynthesis